MDHLWTPWRYEYLRSSQQPSGCIFCTLPAEKRDRENLIVLRRTHTFVILNRFPYSTGHLLIATHRHIPTLKETTSEELLEIVLLARECQQALENLYAPHGFNIGFNLGHCAGAGVAHHLHLHVVPRWSGDSNFVAVVGETRVIPEELSTTYQKIHDYFQTRNMDA
ncbi:MAG: HIT domain-containing protein [Acidobacteria bacterium]|nr:HIT domain-containing protein [Acidobacteriota bacterium]